MPGREARDAWGRVRSHATPVEYVVAWLVLSAVATVLVFLGSSRPLTIAGHDAVLRPDLDGYVALHPGPLLPDVRLESGHLIGVDITLGKTDVESTEELVERYAHIASQPDGQVAQVREALVDLAVDSAVRGSALGLVPVLLWAMVGAPRRRELERLALTRRGGLTLLLAGAMVVAYVQPWETDPEGVGEEVSGWVPLADFLGPGVPLPPEAAGLEVRGDVTTRQTRRLIASAVDTYDKSKTFYAAAAEAAAELELRTPLEDETVVVLVSDRHLNVGMDAVARAVGDAAGATAVFDAGDDTSTGTSWEAFSLDSVSAAFDGPYDDRRWAVAGNHDHGTFVRRYLDAHGWTMLDGTVVEGPGGTTLVGTDDPRASGLGSWRDETGLGFGEVAERLAEAACEHADEQGKVGTVLVHDANLGRPALERGCVDLVVGGHVHVTRGPEPVVAEDGSVGYTFTTGTTGGAAYAIAVGGKIRRTATVSLLTYREGRPAGVQVVDLHTDGRFQVGDYVELDPS